MGLRWWNEVNTTSGDSHWVFESSDPNVRTITATDKRFFWLSLYLTPALWVGLAVLAIVRLVGVIWLSLVGELRFNNTNRSFRPLGLTILQSLLLFSLLQTLWHSPGVTSLVKHQPLLIVHWVVAL